MIGVGRKKVVLIPPPHERVVVEDPLGLGPLPEGGVSFLGQMGALKIAIVAKDGRSWIITGLNSWRGSIRPFIARVFENGYVRDYIAIPPEIISRLHEFMAQMAAQIDGLGQAGGGEEDAEEEGA